MSKVQEIGKKDRKNGVSQGFAVNLDIPVSGMYPETTDIAVNNERSLVERTVNDERVQTSRYNPSLSATIAFQLCLLEILRQRAYNIQHV